MKMESNMEIKVEFLAGTSIEDAAREAKIKAIAWDVAYVIFNFNETKVSVGQSADIDDIVRQYRNNERYIVAA